MSHTEIGSGPGDKKMPWMALLDEALNAPGTLTTAFQLFHRYSLCNQVLAIYQLSPDKLGPIATFKHWQGLGRTVRKGEKAIALYMPFTIKEKDAAKTKTEDKDEDPSRAKNNSTGQRFGFMLRRNWFSLAQTDGEQEPTFESPPEWSVERALSALHVTRVPFASMNGNCQGYAVISGARELAISPLCEHPMRTHVS